MVEWSAIDNAGRPLGRLWDLRSVSKPNIIRTNYKGAIGFPNIEAPQTGPYLEEESVVSCAALKAPKPTRFPLFKSHRVALGLSQSGSFLVDFVRG
ncbi:hypothetical protein OUZ56_010928 [Daphnia magna]|uniref:Uncharacterized protein n=1 Tax=Daphnia magna TaxID=35525 RepID=A0ABQ9YYS3_9CRUS|nr:hypothetical protein OUZ56_010928 [Daphnia magna]